MALDINYTTGYAGTGKSTSLLKKVKSLPSDSTIVIAPTHKALARLSGELPPEIEIKTIHSLLGWIPSINEDAEHINHIDTTIKLDRDLEDYSDIVIDEGGMMSEDMFTSIIAKIEAYAVFVDPEDERDVTIHCYLDPYQTLPVKGKQIQIDPENTVDLTINYRAESLDVVDLYTKFVNYLKETNTSDLTTPYSENVLPLDLNQFKPSDRLLAYTNEAVGNWNKLIAKKLNIKSYVGQEVQLGNMIDTIKVDSFLIPTLPELLDWFENGRLKLQNRQINRKYLEVSLQALLDIKDINFIKDNNDFIYPVLLGVGKAKTLLNKSKEDAVQDRKKFKKVYALGRAFIMDYNFATTVHKSQGSEFKNVFIDKKDIQKSIRNGYYMTYARLMYVAISRARNKVYI